MANNTPFTNWKVLTLQLEVLAPTVEVLSQFWPVQYYCIQFATAHALEH